MQNKILPIIAIIIVIIAIGVIIFVPKDNEKNSQATKTINTVNSVSTSEQISKSKTIDATLNNNGDVEINLDNLETTNATFINYTSNGINLELVAVKDNENNIDVAFNTCQVCNGSPKAYFIQKNGKLVCQNCQNSFSLKSIGSSANACNPITIEEKNITKTDTGIIISKDFLVENESLFTNVSKH